MKNYNPKIDKFFKWLEERNTNAHQRIIVPDTSAFKLYQMENPEVEDLTKDELEYLKNYFEVTIVNQGLINNYRTDLVKFVLMNKFSWSDKAKVEQTKSKEYVLFDSSGLLTENTSAMNHIDESLENDAIKLVEKKEV